MSLPNEKPEEVTEMDFLRPENDRRTRFQVNRVRTESYRAQQEKGGKEIENGENKIKVDSEGDDQDEEFDLHSSTDRTRLNSEHAKSFRQLTREVLPRLDNYRNIMSIQAVNRPTLDELHNATLPSKREQLTSDQNGTIPTEGQVKFGWIQGVLVRCLLNIWGVMLFLRLTWVVAQAGIGQSILLILTTTAVTSITSLSMSAISTNGVIKGGGTYYMISRSLGPEFGGSIGLIFSLANAVACAMYVVGFGESLISFFPFEIVPGFTNNVRIIGCITIMLLLVVVVIGMEWEAKAQFGLLVILLAAIFDFFIGSFIPPTEEQKAKGFVGFNSTVTYQNLFPDYREYDGVNYDFFKVFAVFFPAATGILAGANISGDLKDPQMAIPKGTILAILITTLSYILMAVFSGCTVLRDASGIIAILQNNITELVNITNVDSITDSVINSTAFRNLTDSENITDIKNITDTLSYTVGHCVKGQCKYGLHNNFQVVELVSWFGPIIYAGCFAATLSSALASLVSAPKVFQALCKDKLYPRIEWFAKGYGPNNEPIRGYVLTFIIAIAFILIGELNLIAPLISNFFLAAYTLINFSTFHASLAKPVGWRPTFKYYNMWLSLVGAILCVLVMFLISWWTALLTFATILALYLIVAYRKPNVNWGSTTQAQTYKSALQAMYQLNSVEEHVKNFRPQILVFSGMPSARPTLVHFAHLLTKNLSMLVCGHVNTSILPQRVRNVLSYKANSWLKAHKLKAFYMQVDSNSFEEGAKALLKACGIGKLRPNIILMGHKSDWQTCPKEDLLQYFEILHNAFDLHLGVGILRMQQGLDVGIPLDDDAKAKNEECISRNKSFSQLSDASSNSDLDLTERVCTSPMISERNNKKSKSVTESVVEYTESKKGKSGTESVEADISLDMPQEKIDNLLRQKRQGKRGGTIDVWWLYDDGGLTLLLPYILSTRKSWRNHKLRVFALGNKRDELELEHRNMASLLAKFRIDYSDLQVVSDVTKKPMEETQKLFDSLISNFKVEGDDKSNPVTVSESELMAVQDKTNRHLRLRELLLQHSNEADMVVVTLPIPRKNIISAPLYFAWLEVLTKDMPPILLVRGNQTSVLTFYS